MNSTVVKCFVSWFDILCYNGNR